MLKREAPKSARPRAFTRFAQWLIQPWPYQMFTWTVGYPVLFQSIDESQFADLTIVYHSVSKNWENFEW